MKLVHLIEELLEDLEAIKDDPEKIASKRVLIFGEGMDEPYPITATLRTAKGELILVAVPAVAKMMGMK